MNKMHTDKRDEEAGFGDVSWLKIRRFRSYPFFNLFIFYPYLTAGSIRAALEFAADVSASETYELAS